EMRAFQIFAQSSETTFGRIDRRDPVSRRRELHGLAAGCRAQVEDIWGSGWDCARRKRGGEVLDPPAAFVIARQSGHGAAFEPNMLGRARTAAFVGGIGLRLRAVGEAEVQWRAPGDLPARGGDR